MQDIWQLANIAGLHPSEDLRHEMRRQWARAQVAARRDITNRVPKDILFPSGPHESRKETLIALANMQPFLGSRVLRRTIRSKDNLDQPMFDMPDPCEVTILLDLHPREVDALEKAASMALENSKTDVRWRVVCNIICPL